MDIEARLIKVEVEVETCKEALAKVERAVEDLRGSMERGFAEQRTAMERGFAEQREEMNKHLRWLYGLIFTNLTFTCGILIHLASRT